MVGHRSNNRTRAKGDEANGLKCTRSTCILLNLIPGIYFANYYRVGIVVNRMFGNWIFFMFSALFPCLSFNKTEREQLIKE